MQITTKYLLPSLEAGSDEQIQLCYKMKRKRKVRERSLRHEESL